jgi:hypothetical protein
MLRRLHFILAYALLLSGTSITEGAVLPDVYIQRSDIRSPSFSSRRLAFSTQRSSIETPFTTMSLYSLFASQENTIEDELTLRLDEQTIDTNQAQTIRRATCQFSPIATSTSNASPSAPITRTVAGTLFKDTHWLNANELPFVYNTRLTDSQVYCIDECGNYYASQDKGTTWTGPYHFSASNVDTTDSLTSSRSMDANSLEHGGIGDAYQAEKDQCDQIWSSTDGGLTWSGPDHIIAPNRRLQPQANDNY